MTVDSRLVLGIALVCGCYSPHPQAGAPCVTSSDCPEQFICTASHVCDVAGTATIDASIANPDSQTEIDASLPPDGPAGAICIDAMTLQLVGGTNVTCPWGCITGGSAHCGQLVPSANALVPSDLDANASLLTVAIMNGAMLNSDTGAITGVRTAGTGVISGIGFTIRNKVGIFTFSHLSVDSPFSLTGSNAVALVATGTITFGDVADVRGDCLGSNAGPGGYRGGAVQVAGGGPGGGSAGAGAHDDASGGAGGGFGRDGGAGGPGVAQPRPASGAAYGTPAIPNLIGGSGGGGGGGVNGGVGGGGGGALQLAANGAITIDLAGGINAGGCGGKAPPDDGGGGGGAGGTILIEAPTVTINGALAVNGGGGAGGELNANPGQPGTLTTMRAAGGTSPANSGSAGGAGGARNALPGAPGAVPNSMNLRNAGAGGGSIGRIRVTTLSGTATVGAAAVMSPAFTDLATTATLAAATVQ